MSAPGPPPITIEDRASTYSVDLYNTREHQPSRRSDPRVDAIFSDDSDETFLVGIEESEDIEITGSASANRVHQDVGDPDGPLTSLAFWSRALISMVNGQQGTGWTITNDYTGRTLDCVIEAATITRERGAPFEVEWSLTLQVGSGIMPHTMPGPTSPTPTSPGTIAGQDLHEIETLMISKRQQLTPHTYAFHDPQENEVEAESGAIEEISIHGTVPGPESDRKTFDDAIRAEIGENNTVTFEEPFPGRTIDVMPTQLIGTREAGVTELGDYRIEAVRGITGV